MLEASESVRRNRQHDVAHGDVEVTAKHEVRRNEYEPAARNGRTKETSALTWAEMRPLAALAGLVALTVGTLAVAHRMSPFES